MCRIIHFLFRTSIDQLSADINKLYAQITKITAQMSLPSTNEDVRKQMEDFLPVSCSISYDNAKINVETMFTTFQKLNVLN